MPTKNLIQNLDDLPSCSREELSEQWTKVTGDGLLKGMSSKLIVRILAYDLQARKFGKLKPAIQKKLEDISGADHVTVSKKRSSNIRSCRLEPGTRLVREWNGVSHVVDVMDNGFEWKDKVFKSLSVIAREITGARWSGPRFFGLKREVRA